MAAVQLKSKHGQRRIFLVSGIAGLLLPLLVACLFLLRSHALTAFADMSNGMMMYHASLARRSVSYLLLHSISPLLPLLLLWLGIACFQKLWRSWEYAALMMGIAFGLASYIAQGKGYAYHRYPLIAFLLLVMAIELSVALRERGAVQALAAVGLAFGAFFLAPVSAIDASRYDWQNLGNIGML
jgi:hypothetical protein